MHVDANATYVASYFSPDGSYVADVDFFTVPFDAAPLHAPKGANGVYRYGGGSPDQTSQSANYWADVVFAPDDATAPTVIAVSPEDGSSGVAAGTQARATFSERLDASSVATSTFSLRTAAGAPVPAWSRMTPRAAPRR